MSDALGSGALGRVLTKAPRPAAASALSATVTLGWRALLKIKHVPFQLFDVTATPIMFTLLFTFIFGGALGGSPRDYIQFLLPGILVQTIIFITVYTGVGLNSDIAKGLFDRFRSLPIWQPSPVFGALAGDLLRYAMAGGLVLLVGFLIGFRPGGGAIGVLAGFGIVLLAAFAVTWIWIIVSMFVKTPESVMTTSFLLLFPLMFASNIFVDPATMPRWLQVIVLNNPMTHVTSATRGLMHGTVDAFEVWWVIIASAVCTAIFAPIALWLYHKER